ncbi:fibropellin-1-like [Asterias rubens]|uniref:fibropellin-1-like n=1 Tax=Asterias rubens TaxID=7604 RepID=UPI0014558F22|nr:fibropellin-1-like [Asterias rubens]
MISIHVCVVVKSSAVISFKLKSFSNPDHSELDGGCCDPRFFSCGSCDNYFLICLDDAILGSNDFSDCGIRTIETDVVYTDNDEFNFPAIVPDDIPNPLAISVLRWQGGMRVKLQVWDDDGNGDDLIDESFLNIVQSAAVSQSSAQWTEYNMGTHTQFTFQVKVNCVRNYYNSDCSVYCSPRDDAYGHYTCDQTTGAKLCKPGWQGEQCDLVLHYCEVNPCLNNGTCNDFIVFFNCTCNPDYIYVDGLCDEKDDCAHHPCLNGSTCNDLIGNFSCTCAPGFEGDLCNVDEDECASGPCRNGGNCTEGQLGMFNCTCPAGFDGVLCETDTDECLSDPCGINSTCDDVVNGFVCHCSLGFAGRLCRDEVDECASGPCQHNATCLDHVGYFECNCSDGYFGELCEVDIDFCANLTCANNGTCLDQIDGFHCLCQRGFEGVMCDVETDECMSRPCLHNSTCHDLLANYRCICQDGYEGTNCEADTDECVSSPCRNQSTCVDRAAGFVCLCQAGFQGILCDIEVDECVSSPCFDNETCIDIFNGYRCDDGMDVCANNPCLNDATCMDGGIDFSCRCQAGYRGNLCQWYINECESSPCLNGTCLDLVNGFQCDCAPGYDGTICEHDVDECANSVCTYGTCVDQINGFVCVCVEECMKGQCDNGQCICESGYEGDDCSVQIDYCRSSPCSDGTCVTLVNSFKCECGPFHQGDLCDVLIDNPCSMSPCVNGECITSEEQPNGYQCTCKEGFYGFTCDVELGVYGCVIFCDGILKDAQAFQKNMASLLGTLLSTFARSTEDSIQVEVVDIEEYMRSDNGGPLSQVTFVARSSTEYLPKVTVEQRVNNAPNDLVSEQLGYDVYKGKAIPRLLTREQQSWPATHWYVFLLVTMGSVSSIAVGIIITRKRRSLTINPPDECHINEDDGQYSTVETNLSSPEHLYTDDQSDSGSVTNPVYDASYENCYATMKGDAAECDANEKPCANNPIRADFSTGE